MSPDLIGIHTHQIYSLPDIDCFSTWNNNLVLFHCHSYVRHCSNGLRDGFGPKLYYIILYIKGLHLGNDHNYRLYR